MPSPSRPFAAQVVDFQGRANTPQVVGFQDLADAPQPRSKLYLLPKTLILGLSDPEMRYGKNDIG
jgi:hypothetical protein